MSASKIARAVARRDRAIVKAHEEFRRTLARVHDKGMPVAQIAEAAGLTRQRIYQLLDREGSHEEGIGGSMRNARRTLVVLGVLAVAVAVAVPAAVLTGSSKSAKKLSLSPSFRESVPGRDSANGAGAEGDRRNGFAQEDYENRAYPAAAVQFAQVQNGFKAATKIRTAAKPPQPQFNWNEVGPNLFSSQALSTQTYGPPTEWSGRITALAVNNECNAHGGNSCRVYVAAAGGGVWRADNALAPNPNWKNITDDQLASTAIGSILIDPTDGTGNRMYAGTGEENGSSDSEAGVGLYRSTDGGDTWSLLPASQSVSYNRAIGAIAVDRTNPNRLYIGTIEARHGLSSNSGGRFTPPNAPQMGIYVSTNGGASWSPALIKPQDTVDPTSPTGGDTQFGGVTDIQQDPFNSQYLYAGMPGYGLWRSTDGGATWNQIFTDTADVVNSGGVTPRRYEFAVARLANGNTRIYLYEGTNTGGVLRRIDDARAAVINNGSWTQLSSTSNTQPGFFVNNICNGQCWYDLVIASPPAQPDTVVVGGVMRYAELITRGNPAWSNGRAVVRSTDAGVHWTDMTGDNTPRAGGYLWNYENLHPDQHAIAFNPANPNIIFFGMDGGLTRTDGQWDNQSADCQSAQRQLFAPITGQNLANCQAILSAVPHKLITMNRGLATIQFQSMGVNPNSPMNDALAGTQDNGTPAFTGGPNWVLTMSGDGGDSGIDVANGNIRFHTYTGTQTETNFHGNDQEQWDWTGDTMFFSGETAGFYAPMLQDPVTPGQIFAGMNHVWRTQDSGGPQAFLDAHCNSPGIFGTSDQLFTGNCGDYVTLGDPSTASTSCGMLNSTCYGADKRTGSNASDYVVALARAMDNTHLYAATRRGRLFVSLNGNANPASSVGFYRLDDSTTPTRYISSVTVDHDHPEHLIVTFSGYNAYATAAGTATGHVFDVVVNFASCTAAPTPHCTATWTNLDKNIGDQPILDSVFDWRTGTIYISTDWGVLKGSRNTSVQWTTAGNGLPPVAVYGLNLNALGNGPNPPRVLYAVTHGRGAWRAMLPGQ